MINRSYYKNIRIYKGFSLRELSKLTGIHYQQINRFEQDMFDLNDQQIQILQEILNFSEYYNRTSYMGAMNLFNEFYASVVKNDANLSDYIKMIPEHHSDINEKIVYLVIQYVISVLDKDEIKSHEIECFLSKCIIDNKLLYHVFLDYKGVHLFNNNQYIESIELFKNLLSLDLNDAVKSMVLYHLGFVYKNMNNLIDAFTIFTNAKENFHSNNCLSRVFGCNLMLANILLRSRKYEVAEIEYLECLHFGNSIDIEASEIAKVYRNLSWLMIKEKNYDKAEFYLDKAKLIDANHDLVYVYDTWITYKKKKYNTAKKKIKNYKCLTTDSEVVMILDLFESLCYLEDRKPTLKIVEQCKKVYEYFDLTNNVDLTLFYLDILIELLDRRKDYEKLAFYQKNKIILLEK